jgi:hypothetical protein
MARALRPRLLELASPPRYVCRGARRAVPPPSQSSAQKASAWTFVRSAAVTVLAIDDADLPPLEVLMRKYADRPMDFTDATLVRLAERERLSTIFTIDHDDFETYRIDGRRRFHIVPDR